MFRRLSCAFLPLLLFLPSVLAPAYSAGGGEPALVMRPCSVKSANALSHPDQKIVAQTALRCLHDIADTGASAASCTETRRLEMMLDARPQPDAKRLSTVLKSVLSCHDDSGYTAQTQNPRVFIPSIPSIPRDLADRAAAACAEKSQEKPDEIVLSFAGDCTFGTVNSDDSAIRFPSVFRRASRADYPFAQMKPWFLNDDLTVVNFECTLTNAVKTADKQWHFKGDARYASIFPAGSVEAVGLSNNHSLDYLQKGFNDTVASFKKADVPVFFRDKPLCVRLKGVEVVLIGDCTVVGENTTQIDGTPARVIGEIKQYKKPGSIIIVVMHWGSELAAVPFPWQQALGRKFIDAGADAVVGHHPHVVQGIECYRGKYIAYSLGNFAFGGNSLARFPETFVLQLRFRTERGKLSAGAASLVPCWTTSSQVKNNAGVLRNNYQPKPVFGKTEDLTAALILARSAKLTDGVKTIHSLRLR